MPEWNAEKSVSSISPFSGMETGGIVARVVILVLIAGLMVFLIGFNNKAKRLGTERFQMGAPITEETKVPVDVPTVEDAEKAKKVNVESVAAVPASSHDSFKAVDFPVDNKFPRECFPRDKVTPQELMPNLDAINSQYVQMNPLGQGDISNQNFLTAGYHIGINTQGQSLRNPNLSLRSEPPNPREIVSPWNQSTIEPDLNRRPLEIGGSGCA